MVFTLPFIHDTFARYNKLIFGSRLPDVPIRLTRAYTFVGKCVLPRRNSPADIRHGKGCSIRFSICFNLSQAELADIVIHEMIHLYIYTQGIPDNASHGKAFLHLMEQINRRFGRHLTVKHQQQTDSAQPDGTQGGEVQRRRRRRFCVVATIYLTDGRIGLKVLPRVYETIGRFVTLASTSPIVSRITVGFSEDPFFDNYPSSGALRYYVPDNTDWVKLVDDPKEWPYSR